ncbi:hypothetical protein HQ563_04405 [bacterium]|nr:hypothetical protein [bacterium]
MRHLNSKSGRQQVPARLYGVTVCGAAVPCNLSLADKHVGNRPTACARAISNKLAVLQRHNALPAVSDSPALGGSILNLAPAVVHPGELPLAGSDAYIVIAGKLFPDPECVEPRMVSIGTSAISARVRGTTVRNVPPHS